MSPSSDASSGVSGRDGARLRRLAAREDGQELVELVLVLPILLVVLFGLVELGNAFDVGHSMSTLSREGANIASRGAELDEVLDVVLANGEGIGLESMGGAVATRLMVQGGVPRVVEQRATDGFEGRSELGPVGAAVPGLEMLGLVEGRRYHALELFYGYRAITPIHRLLGPLVPDTIYDRAIF